MIGGILNLIIKLFLMPWLIINFLVEYKFEAMWEIKKAINIISRNFKEYSIALIKQIGYAIIFFIYDIFNYPKRIKW